jgi:hypothetical protein
MSKFTILLFLLGASIQSANSQVLISLLLGDKLNSPNLEFGLEGGLNWSNIKGGEEFSVARDFHLGFYFDFRIKNEWYFHTGVRVKTAVGAEGVPVYPTGDSGIDSVFASGEVHRQLNYFYVPATVKHRFKNNFYLEGGFQTGLLYQATDLFVESIYDNSDAAFQLNVRDEYNRIDFGLAAGIGYKIMKNTGMSVGLLYYHGVVDIYKDSRTGYNRSLYAYIFIPIGKGKAAGKAAAKEADSN